MRLVIVALSLALAAVPVAARAQTPLAPGEVLLELGSIGTATVPADLATIRLLISGTGATEAAARADLETKYRLITAAARQAGVPAAAITRGELNQGEDLRIVQVREAPPQPAEEPPPPGMVRPDAIITAPPSTPSQPPTPSYYSSSAVTVRVTDMALVPALRRALDAAAATEYGSAIPVYSLTDNRAARQAARAQALAAVRADADAYAASLGMRVARIVRVSERTGVGLLPLLLGDPSLPRRLFGPGENRDPNVTVLAVVGVDFALAPR
ncbi:MAG TPA: SIMPL domain-containing protein [Allosphingosinicella sp.]|jgi:uncharacterized protein YggE|nr:SIMPL domain-containing protein [Allosphingosinicella sp.]